jgi:hypothetical protein
VNGKPVPASVTRNAILITDRNTFRFPKASGVGTHPAGHFTVNPNTRPKEVDSIAEGGPKVGQLTRARWPASKRLHVAFGGADKSFNIGKRWDLYLRVDPLYEATLSEIASASLHQIEPEIALFKQPMLGT